MTTLYLFLNRRHLFAKCLVLSVAIHLFTLLYFYTHPFLLKSSFHDLFKFSSKTPLLLHEEEDIVHNEVLAEVFEKLLSPHPDLNRPLDSLSLPQGLTLSPLTETTRENASVPTESVYALIQEASKETTPALFPFFEKDKSLLPLAAAPSHAPSTDDHPFTTFTPSIETFFLPAPLDANKMLTDLETPSWDPTAALPSKIELPQTVFEDKTTKLTLKTEKELLSKNVFPAFTKRSPQVKEFSQAIVQRPSFPPFKRQETPADISQYDLPDLATAEAWGEGFCVNLQFTPEKDGSGYLFAIDIMPSDEMEENILPQVFYFILDRSYSLKRHKFAVFKRAVLKALASMQPGEFFNICFLDRKGGKMSPTPIPYSMQALLAAEEFLNKQEVSNAFVSSNVFASLEHLLSEIPADDSVHTAIILTDGHFALKPVEEQRLIKSWIEKNHGKLSLYTAAVGQKNNLVSLDLLSRSSGGKLLYSDTHAAFPRKLAKLIIDLHNPIACDISLAAIPSDDTARITLSHTSSHLPVLHAGKPYEIVGKIEQPCDFELVLKGRNEENWVTLEEKISFKKGDLATSGFDVPKDLFQMHTLYAKFLREGGVAPLKDAKEILKKSHDAIAFE